MNFAAAIRTLNDGKLVAREHWPRGCYVGLAVAPVAGVPRAYIVARSEAGQKSPWIADRADVEAADWGEATQLSGDDAQRRSEARKHYLPAD